MDGACKEWWYKDKIMGVTKKGYFCLFQSYILTINYRCLEDLLLIFGPSWAQNTFSHNLNMINLSISLSLSLNANHPNEYW